MPFLSFQKKEKNNGGKEEEQEEKTLSMNYHTYNPSSFLSLSLSLSPSNSLAHAHAHAHTRIFPERPSTTLQKNGPRFDLLQKMNRGKKDLCVRYGNVADEGECVGENERVSERGKKSFLACKLTLQ